MFVVLPFTLMFLPFLQIKMKKGVSYLFPSWVIKEFCVFGHTGLQSKVQAWISSDRSVDLAVSAPVDSIANQSF